MSFLKTKNIHGSFGTRSSQKHQSVFHFFCLEVATDSSILMRPYLTLAYIYSCAKSVPKMTLRLNELYENEFENSSESLISGCILRKRV